MNYNTLENTSIENLHNTFVEAFSDYQIKIDLPLSKLHYLLRQRGYTDKVSIGAFDNNVLVGFILNAIRQWDGKLTAYDTGTGVVKKYRNKGITTNMFLNTKELLKEKGIHQYLLEVIQSNESAVHLYKKQGFEISREFECFNLDKNMCTLTPLYKVKHIDEITESNWVNLMKFWDFKPSWQNSVDSVNAVSDAFIYSVVTIDDTIVGYGIINKNTGDIPQIAVDKNHRGKGIGSSILIDLLNNTKSSNISIVNVDSMCSSINNFLMSLGFKQSIKQYEMILKL